MSPPPVAFVCTWTALCLGMSCQTTEGDRDSETPSEEATDGAATGYDATAFTQPPTDSLGGDARVEPDVKPPLPAQGSWRAGPCDGVAACAPAGYIKTPVDEKGPGIENCLTDATGLVMLGRFLSLNGTLANRIARWNGTRWSALGEGVNLTGEGLVVYQGRITIGGAFTKSGTAAVERVAAYDETKGSWVPLGAGLDATVRTLGRWNGLLVAGGHFMSSGGSPMG